MEAETSHGASGAATRALIISAARDLFAERGFRGTTVREIARRCRLTDPALYYHFVSKQALLQAVLEETPPAISLAGLPPAAGREEVAAYYNGTFRYWAENLTVGRTLIAQTLNSDAVAAARLAEVRRGLEAAIPHHLVGVYGENSGLVGLGMRMLGSGLFAGETLRATRASRRADDSTLTRSRVSAAVKVGCPSPAVARWAGTVPLPARRLPPLRPGPPAPSEGAERTRLRILEAALALFSERGFSATTVKAIGARCGLTDAALYYHFHSKTEILESLDELPHTQLVPAAPEGQLNLEWLARFVDGILGEFEAERDAIRLGFRQILLGNAVVAGQRYLAARGWWKSMAIACEATYPPGEARARADIVAAIRIGIPHTLLVEAAMGAEAVPFDVLRPRLLRAVAALLPVDAGLSAS